MSYESACRLALTIHHDAHWCQIVAISGHGFAVEIPVPAQSELYVCSAEQWVRVRSRLLQ
jgi:hypothetical protein